MAYATQTDLEALVSSNLLVLVSDDNADKAADTSVVTAALDDATAQIDAALVSRGIYTVPVTSPGTYLKGLCCRLAVKYLCSVRRPAMASVIPETVRDLWKSAEADLVAIRRGELIVTEALSTTSSPLGISTESEADRGWADAELF